ncbi:MAG: lamin tail domain-containing protein [Deltaproteobacteria bacterium]|nr:lamin tail domain-containing protein [Deltaproteobacteria bacterium]
MRSFLAVVAIAILAPGVAFAQARMVINEFVANPASTDTGKEWIELYNAGDASQNLDGWKLKSATTLKEAATYSTKVTFTSAHVVPAGEYFVICETEPNCPVTADLIDSMSLPNGTGGDGLQLTEGDTPVDTVAYGDASNSDLIEEDGGTVATNLAPKPGDDQAIARRQDGVDTQVSGLDFWIASSNTPGAANPAPPPCEEESGWVVINEFVPNPAGTDSGFEWVEVYNAHATDAIRLDDWVVRAATSADSYSAKFEFPAETSIPAGGYLVVGEEMVTSADFTSTLGMGNGSDGDGVRLTDCKDTVADTVVYGDQDNLQEVVDDSGSIATSVAPRRPGQPAGGRRRQWLDRHQRGPDAGRRRVAGAQAERGRHRSVRRRLHPEQRPHPGRCQPAVAVLPEHWRHPAQRVPPRPGR